MKEIESLAELLKKSQIYEEEKVDAYWKWAQKTNSFSMADISQKLEKIAAASYHNIELFKEALAMINIITKKKEQNNNDISLTNVPIIGNVKIPERLSILNVSQHSAVLATSIGDHPYTSLVAFALTPDFKGALFATPRKTLKYRNLVKSPNVALLIDNRTNTMHDLRDAEAVTLIGKAKALRKGKRHNELKKVFLRKHPILKTFVEAESSTLIHIEAERYIHVSSFQSVTVWEL